MYSYNPDSIMNPQLQLQNYLSEQLLQNSTTGFRQALGNPPTAASRACGVVAGYLLAQLILDVLDL